MDEKNKSALIPGFDAAFFDTNTPNPGGPLLRHPLGDHRFRITDIDVVPTKKQDGHNMEVTVETVAALLGGDETAVGMTTTLRYGTPTSKKFHRERGANLLAAVGIRGPFTPKQIIGREFDATVIWRQQAPQIDEVTGEQKVYVNSEVIFERKAGSPRPPKAPNPVAASAAAIKYLEEHGDGADGAARERAETAGNPPPWEPSANAAPNGGSPATATSTSTAGTAVPQWLPEEQVAKSASVHIYRAAIALSKPKAADYRKALADRKIDPDGPVHLDHLTEPLRSEYLASMAKKPKEDAGDDLPPLDVPSAAPSEPAGTKPRTGTRSKPPQPAA